MPIENYEQDELLAYVEQQLDAEAEAALIRRLEQDPQIRLVLDRMRDDRGALRATPQPEIPFDLVAALESRLARPMLLEQRAGSYRRSQRRLRRTVPWRQLAAAAMLLVVLGGGLWGGSMLLQRNVADDPLQVASGAETHASSIDSPISGRGGEAGSRGDSWPPSGTTIHHRHPLPPTSRAASSSSDESTASGATRTADFLLVMESRDVTVAENALIRVLEDLTGTSYEPQSPTHTAMALVRNFTYDEALAILKRPHPSVVDSDVTPQYADGAGSAPSRENGERLRKQIDSMVNRIDRGRGGDELAIESRQLCGKRDLAPTYADQLELSRRGATHTVAVPSALVAKLLERLEFHAVARTTIEPLPPAPVGHPPEGGVLPHLPETETLRLQRWISQRDLIREQLLELRRQTPEGVVLVPIAIVAD